MDHSSSPAVATIASSSPSLLLDEQFCFALYAASRSVTSIYRPLLEKLGLTYPQYLAMLVLWESDGITVRELGQRLMLDSGTLTPLLKRLEQAGLLQRQRRRSDERELQINLTPAGDTLRQQAGEIPGCLLERLCLDIPKLKQWRDELKQLVARLHSPHVPGEAP